MIWDRTDNVQRYAEIQALPAQALAALDAYAERPVGRYELDKDNLFVLVQEYDTRPLQDSQWEVHRAYIDIQCIVWGREYIGTAQAETLKVKAPYDPALDAGLYTGAGTLCLCGPGNLMVFFPGEAHMPCVAVEGPRPVRKLVVKIRAGS